MKNLKLLALAIILISQISLKVLGQVNGKYYPVAALDRFAGTWESVNAEKKFQLVLVKKKVYLKHSDAYTDHIEGYYIYNSSRSTDDAITVGMMNVDNEGKASNDVLYFLIKDNALSKHGQCLLELDSGPDSMASLRISNTEGMRSDKYNMSFSIPTDLKLRKTK